MATRIAVLNDEIYRISEAKYKKIMSLGVAKEKHQQVCELIRQHGRKILDADIIVRDD